MDSIQDQVIADLEARKQQGKSAYGTLLYPHNGRDMMQDLYEELLDACCYVKGVMLERDNHEPEEPPEPYATTAESHPFSWLFNKGSRR